MLTLLILCDKLREVENRYKDRNLSEAIESPPPEEEDLGGG